LFTSGSLNSKANKHKPEKIAVDAIGYGAGVADELVKSKYPCIRVNVAETSIDQELYKNQRAQYFWQLREGFQDNLIKLWPEDEELAAQLSSLKYKINTAGQIQIESKDDMRTRLGRSPDYADAAMLTEAEEGQCVVFDPSGFVLPTAASKWRT